MANKKLTKAQKYDMLLELAEVKASEILTEFIKAEKELLAKKASKVSGKVNEEKEANKALILEALEVDTNYTVSDIIKLVPEFDGFTTQKVSPLCKALVEDGSLEKVEDSKKTLYRLAKVGA